MKNLSRIWRYIAEYRGSMALYFLCTILSSGFAVMSMSFVIPILNVLFFGREKGSGASGNWMDQLLDTVQKVAGTDDKLSILGIICIIVVIATLLKNLFSFLA